MLNLLLAARRTICYQTYKLLLNGMDLHFDNVILKKFSSGLVVTYYLSFVKFNMSNNLYFKNNEKLTSIFRFILIIHFMQKG